MLVLNDRAWPKPASIPGLVSATPAGLVISAQSVRWFGDVYDVPETTVPIAWPGEPTRFRVALTRDGLVLDDTGEAPGEICYLAALTLREPADTPENVEVEVIRRTCTTATPEGATVHPVPPGLIVPPAPPERAARAARAARIANLRAGLAAKPIETMTLAELRIVVATLVEIDGVDLATAQPKGRR